MITLFLSLLLRDEVRDLIKNSQYKKKVMKQVIDLTATQEPLHVEDGNGPILNVHPLIKEQKDGQLWPRVYPYSVVEGGVHSVQELQSAISRDSVVAEHYSNFRLDRARVIEAEADGDFHVSYRMGGEIFWTKKRLKVAKGERLITDGPNFIRTRCANMLSEVPRGKTSADEPTPELLDTPTLPPWEPTPFITPVVMGGGPPVTTPPLSDSPPFIPSGVIGGGPSDPPGESKDTTAIEMAKEIPLFPFPNLPPCFFLHPV